MTKKEREKRPRGRPRSSASVKTRYIANKLIEEGNTPLEVMIRAMREHVARAEATGDLDEWDAAAAVAKEAAPYIHPKLGIVQHQGEGGGAIKFVVERIAATLQSAAEAIDIHAEKLEPERPALLPACELGVN